MSAFAGFHLNPVIVVTLVTTVVLTVVGLILLGGGRESRRANVGAALLSGACFTLAAGFNQLTVEASSFRSSVAMTSDLTGFDANGRSLDGFTLSGKNLHAAVLEKAEMSRANLAFSDLKEANLQGAHLDGANLFYAKFKRSALQGADLTDANLKGAEISTADIEGVKFSGARVHGETCWLVRLDDVGTPSRDGQHVVDAVLAGGLETAGGVLGHVCTSEEGGRGSDEIRTFLCTEEPHLRTAPRSKTDVCS